MINLLPPNEKRQLHAARSNSLLIRYNIFLIGAIIFLLLAIGFVYVYLNNTKATAEQTINENKSKVSGYTSVESQAANFRSNLATAKQILDREVTYTKVILAIAKLLPQGTALENLNLDASTFGTETPLVALAKDYDSALAIKDSFQKSPLFSNVHFESIVASTAKDTLYPITVNLKVTIKKDAAKQ
jgi:Tfp pilus assembly protein PilN